MNEALKPCPFCGATLTPNANQADLYVRRYGTHYEHPTSECHLGGHEVSPSEVAAWNRRGDGAALQQQPEPVACEHKGGHTPKWDHIVCDDCGAVQVGVEGWGIAARKWFQSLEVAKFYRDHGRYPALQQQEEPRERDVIADIIRAHLGDVYHCTRVWTAWGVGTMGEDDFEPAWESSLADEVADAILASPQPPEVDPPAAHYQEGRDLVDEADPDAWYCEQHPERLMGHGECTGAGIQESCRIHMLLNKLRLAKQETRETAMARDDLAAQLRRALAASPVAADTQGDAKDALELVRDCSSQEWQQADGKRMAATDNQGRRFWFITDDVMQAVRAALEEMKHD